MVIEGTTIKLVRGNTGVLNVSCSNEADVPIPLVVGDTVYLTVKKTAKDEEESFQKVVKDFPDGKARILIQPVDTKLLLPGKYIYDVRVDFADGTIETVVEGSEFTIKPAITNE